MNIEEINNTVIELENGPTSFASCQKLASLYIIQDRYNKTDTEIKNVEEEPKPDKVKQELSDILPQYQRYREIKRKFQLGEVTENAVLNSVDAVCREIKEFLRTLYGSTDMQEERDAIIKMVQSLVFENGS